jgi:hypothetical protein
MYRITFPAITIFNIRIFDSRSYRELAIPKGNGIGGKLFTIIWDGNSVYYGASESKKHGQAAGF